MLSEPDPKRLGFRGEPIVKGSETIYEIIRREEGFSFGLALVCIEGGWNEAHFHEKTGEVYVVVWGELEVRLADITWLEFPVWRKPNQCVSVGTSLVIHPRQGHQAIASTLARAWFYVFTFPPFDRTDYHVLS